MGCRTCLFTAIALFALATPAKAIVIDFESLPSGSVVTSPLEHGDYRFLSATFGAGFVIRSNSGSNAIDPFNFFGVTQDFTLERVDGTLFQLEAFDAFPQFTSSPDSDPFVGGHAFLVDVTDALGVTRSYSLTYPGHLRGAAIASTRYHVDLLDVGVDYAIKAVRISDVIGRYPLQFDNFDVTAGAVSVPEPATMALMLIGITALTLVHTGDRRSTSKLPEFNRGGAFPPRSPSEFRSRANSDPD